MSGEHTMNECPSQGPLAPGFQPVLLLLHHLQPPLEWRRAVSVLQAAVSYSEEGHTKVLGSSEERWHPGGASVSSLSAPKLKQILRDVQNAIYEGYLERMALVQQGALHPRGLGVFMEAQDEGYQTVATPIHQKQLLHQHQQETLPPPGKPSARTFQNVERLFSAVPAAATVPFFRRALPLLVKAVLMAEQIFPRCRHILRRRTATGATAAASTTASNAKTEIGRLQACTCGSCRLRLQLYKHCSSGVCSVSTGSKGSVTSGLHVASCPAEISAAEGWVLFGLGLFGLLPPPEWQKAATGLSNLGDISFVDFFDFTGMLLLLLKLRLILLVLLLLFILDSVGFDRAVSGFR